MILLLVYDGDEDDNDDDEDDNDDDVVRWQVMIVRGVHEVWRPPPLFFVKE